MDQFDLNKEVTLHRIGACPSCGKGQMVKGTAGWTCDHFRSLEDKCSFTIFSSYNGYALTEDDAVDLITKGETEVHGFVTREGAPYEGRLALRQGRIRVLPKRNRLAVPCPLCQGTVYATDKGYFCGNYFKTDESHCGIAIPKEICHRAITEEEAADCLAHGKGEVLDGFSRQDGRTFSSLLSLKDGKIVLDASICACPQCGGTVYAGEKAYNCGNFSNPSVRCGFTVWRRMFQRDITKEDVQRLCRDRLTPPMDFLTKDGKPLRRQLMLTPEGQVKLL